MNDREKLAKRIEQFEMTTGVYPVSCEKLAAGRSDKEWLNRVLQGGAKIVQLRDKTGNDRELLAKARYFRDKTREADALFIINDRVDIALLANADGVHVGQDDIPPEEVRKIAPDKLIGVSCNRKNHVEEIGRALATGKNSADYYNIGPLFATSTKEGLREFLGIDAVETFSSCCNLPFTVMGGIKKHHIEKLVEKGAKRIAVVTAISEAANIAAETSSWMNLIQENIDE